jgi:hypothetical protein
MYESRKPKKTMEVQIVVGPTYITKKHAWIKSMRTSVGKRQRNIKTSSKNQGKKAYIRSPSL